MIVEDHTLFAVALDKLISNIDGMHSLGVFNSHVGIIKEIETQDPDILLLDLNMPDVGGFDILQHLQLKQSKIKTIVISMLIDPMVVHKALQLGVMGYLPKNTGYNELKEAISAVVAGKNFMNANLEAEIKKIESRGPNENTDYNQVYNLLSKREKEILKLIAQGLTNKQIAEKVFLSPLTVKTHRHNILQKLNLNNTASVVRFVTSLGIV